MKGLLVFLVVVVSSSYAQTLGTITNFKQKDQGNGYVELEWDFTAGDSSYPLHKYTLLTDNDFANDVRCFNPHCTYIIDYLSACVEHLFEITPHYDTPEGSEVLGDKVATTGYTDDKPPGAPNNVVVVAEDDTGTTLAWDAPTQNPSCVDHYQVCSRLDGQINNICEETSDTTVVLSALQACGTYHVTVSAVTPSGSMGPMLSEDITTADGVPGEPEDVIVALTTPETILLKWNDPLSNPLCVDKYVITYGEATRTVMRVDGDYAHEATVSPLLPCTNYTIDLYAVNAAELQSPKVTTFAATAETEPMSPPSVIVGANGPTSIEVVWGLNENDRCVGSFEVCWNDGVHPYENCETVGGGGGSGSGGGDGNIHFNITDLQPCSSYDVGVSTVTPGGIIGDPTFNTTSTEDVKPSPVQNLKITSVTTTAMTITFDPPATHPQCVKEYDIRIIDQDISTSNAELDKDGSPLTGQRQAITPYLTDTVSGLEPCTNYLIKVRAVTPSNLLSTWEETHDKTGDDVSSEPQEFGMSAVTQTSITLQWYSPVSNPNCVSQYVLSWDSNQETISDDGQFKTEHTVTGLSPCTPYTFSLTAETSMGQSGAADFTTTTECPF